MFRKLSLMLTVLLLAVGAASYGQARSAGDGPTWEAADRLAFPADYREWIFVSSGLGMNYGPNAPPAGQPQSFTNVYVNPTSYRAFMKTGAWPDRTMFVLEIRHSASEGSINRSGRYQTGLRAIEANVKDARLPGGWEFFDFGVRTDAVAPLPRSASCYTCHATNTAVEHTFVQFYPSLMEVARRMGTVKPGYSQEAGR
jgi:hypothetical protein